MPGGPISAYLINYSEQARKNRLTPLVGREKELERLLHILLRGTKLFVFNNLLSFLLNPPLYLRQECYSRECFL